MKAAYLVSRSASFEDDVWQAASALGWEVQGDVAQVRDEAGRLLTVFGGLGESHASDWRDDLVPSPALDAAPDLSDALAVSVECRWEDMFATVVRRLAAHLPGPTWVVDGNGVVWPAGQVDPGSIQL